ncbi:MAG: tyrosine-type recombinase/integrase [Actinomycetota bacterium]|nr:tyrosine-type recombinase/integrase [Actinomycetota bacterium]
MVFVTWTSSVITAVSELTNQEPPAYDAILTNLTAKLTANSTNSPDDALVTHTTKILSKQWEDAISAWTLWLKLAGRRHGTIQLRRDHIRSIARRSRTERPDEITLSTLVSLCSERNWSNEHRRSVRTSLISFYDWAIEMELVSFNPAVKLPKVKPPAPAPRPAPDDVWEELIAAAPPRERLMARLAGEAGLRRSEVALVHSDDLIRDVTGWSLIVHGKGGKQRVVPLNDGLAAEFRLMCTRHGYVFPGQVVEAGHVDGHVSASWVGISLSRLMPTGWSMHKLRHRFATLGYAGTGNLRAVQEALGHASVATTQRYTAVSNVEVRSVSDAAADRHLKRGILAPIPGAPPRIAEARALFGPIADQAIAAYRQDQPDGGRNTAHEVVAPWTGPWGSIAE